MDQEGNSSSKQNENKTDNKSNEEASNNTAITGIPAKKEIKTKGRKTRKKKGLKSDAWIPFIVAIAPILIAIINSQTILNWLLGPEPTPTFTPTTVFITDTPILTFTFTPSLTSSLTATDISTASVTPSTTDATIESTPISKMFVKLTANRNTGRPPLHIRFDARDSYLLEPNGTRLACRGGPCFYTWSVYSGGQQIGRAENNSIGTFEYTFGQNGTYTVTVVVCRGRNSIDCAGSGTQVVVSK